MDFALSEERQMLKDTAERFVRESYPIEKRHASVKSETGFDRRALDRFLRARPRRRADRAGAWRLRRHRRGHRADLRGGRPRPGRRALPADAAGLGAAGRAWHDARPRGGERGQDAARLRALRAREPLRRGPHRHPRRPARRQLGADGAQGRCRQRRHGGADHRLGPHRRRAGRRGRHRPLQPLAELDGGRGARLCRHRRPARRRS